MSWTDVCSNCGRHRADCDCGNWNNYKNNKKVFKIEVGNIPDEEVEDYIKKVAEKFKKATQIQPDLDCGIYPDDNEIFLPTNIEKKMPEKPDLQKIQDAIYSKRSTAHYMHVIPNSHFWTDLKQIAYSIDHELERQKREAEPKTEESKYTSVYIGEPLTADYILIGLGNSLMRGYNLKQNNNLNFCCGHGIIFVSVEDMIEYIFKVEILI